MKKEKKFVIDGKCRLESSFMTLYQSLNGRNIKFVSNIVTDRPSKLTDTELGKDIVSRDYYLFCIASAGCYNEDSTADDPENIYPEKIDEIELSIEDETQPPPGEDIFNENLRDIISDCGSDMTKCGTSVNRLDISNTIDIKFRDIVTKLTTRFYETVKNGSFWPDVSYPILEVCPKADECNGYDEVVM